MNGKTTSKADMNGHSDSDFSSRSIPLNPEYAFTPRKLRVVTIGAGFSGLLMAHKFQHRFPELQDYVQHTIYEARSDVGGTWLINSYPGVQCDVPSHIYAFPFDPNPNWSHFYSSGEEIQAYIKNTVKKWNLDRDLQLNTKVAGALWEEDSGSWKLTIEKDGKQREEYCDILISAQGVLVYAVYSVPMCLNS
jgi:cation diffusion facilitator CzcD-associated flavoprotein CzcO